MSTTTYQILDHSGRGWFLCSDGRIHQGTSCNDCQYGGDGFVEDSDGSIRWGIINECQCGGENFVECSDGHIRWGTRRWIRNFPKNE